MTIKKSINSELLVNDEIERVGDALAEAATAEDGRQLLEEILAELRLFNANIGIITESGFELNDFTE